MTMNDNLMNNKLLTDFNAWTCSMVCLIAILCAMLGIGVARGWNVDPSTGRFSFYTVNDPSRFWDEPNVNNATDQTIPGRAGPYASSSWYYWRLPPPDQTTVTRLVPWVLYLAHQLSVWFLIWYAQNARMGYSKQLRDFNIFSIVVNVFFHLAHLVQTQLTYDSLAPEVSEASSQGSVILLLCMILMMEYPTRGLFFGWPGPDSESRLRLPLSPVGHLKRYHGYYFAWAAIYTFWYHPMESTIAHFMGFMHTTLILIQGSLMYTPLHKNIYWRLLLETWVLFHATTVAFQQQQGTLWRMFFFGFFLILVLTSLHGIPFFRKNQNRLIAISPFIAWIASVATAYGVQGDAKNLNEVIRIPAVLYGLFCVIYFMTYVTIKARDVFCVNLQSSNKQANHKNRILGVTGFIASYAMIILISTLVEVYHVQMDLLNLAIILIVIYSIFVPISMISLDLTLEQHRHIEIIEKPSSVEDALTEPVKKDSPIQQEELASQPSGEISPLPPGTINEQVAIV